MSFLWIWGFHTDAAKTHVYWDIRACRHVCGRLTLNTGYYDPSEHLQLFSSLQGFSCQKICLFKFSGLTEPKSSSWSLQDPIIYLNFKNFKQFFANQDRLGLLAVPFFNPKLGISWHCQSQIDCMDGSSRPPSFNPYSANMENKVNS
jgi:hypothetical protein